MKKTQSVIQRVAVLAALAIALLCVPAQAKTKYKMPYYITVDLTNQIVTVYNTADDSIARQMLCSSGQAEGRAAHGCHRERPRRLEPHPVQGPRGLHAQRGPAVPQRAIILI